MKGYTINYSKVGDYSSEEFMVVLECLERYVNSTEFVNMDVVFSILGFERCEEEKVVKVKQDLENLIKEMQHE